MEAVFTFHNTHHAIRGEQILLEEGIKVKVMPLPDALGAGCGVCLRVGEDELDAALNLLARADIAPEGVYWKIAEGGKNSYKPLKNSGQC